MEQTFMKERRVLPLVVSMSLPMVVSMLVTALYNIVDSYFVAKISEQAMTALSLVYPIQNLINAVAVGFGVGLNTAAAYYLGAEDLERASDAASLGVSLSVAHGLILTLLCEAMAPWFLGLFTSDAAVLAYGTEYAAIVVAFSVPITVGIAFEKLFQAEGKMKVAMASMISGCVVNVLLDPVLIFGLGPIPALGIRGAAWATGIGQVSPLAVYIAVYLAKPAPLRVRLRREMWNGPLCRRLYAVGIPTGVNMALPSLLITALNGILAGFSAAYVLVLGIYYKLQTFIYLTANGIVQGIRPIVGYNYGAGEYGRVHQTYCTALALTAAVMGAGTVICMTAAGPLIGLFTESPETMALGKTALRIISVGFVVSSLSVTLTGVLEGLGRGSLSLGISLMRYLVIIVPMAYILSRLFGPVGVWHAFWVAEALTGLAAWQLYRKRVKNGILAVGR
ncbi:MAG: MATE family efflux transporter [Oscillospiraceae bacterium]|nr:MATE family efflux transporter [Oscillospiraceae bacterium]